jgi:hypothetical protein
MSTTAGEKEHWTNVLHNPTSIRSLYSTPPDVVELLRLAFDREGPRLDLVGRLDRYPDRPPPKWQAAKSNVAVATIRLEGLSGVNVADWATTNGGLLVATSSAPNCIDFSFGQGDKVIVAGRAMVVQVVEFGHYFDPGP